jgi:hypothetical protein
MTISRSTFLTLTACIAALLLSPAPVYAYIGPGAGLTAFGALIALVAGLLFAVVGFIWYPIRRFVSFLRQRRSSHV